jgi:hypothetical protein
MAASRYAGKKSAIRAGSRFMRQAELRRREQRCCGKLLPQVS